MNWQKESARLLKDEIEDVLSALSGTGELRDLVREPLTKTRRGLALDIEHDRPWSLLPLIVSEAICSEYERALPAAAAFQFLLAAGDVFDDIEDADSSDSIYAKYGLAVAISVASTLLILGECSLTRLKSRGIDADIIVRTIEAVNSFYTTACAGQHLDLTVETRLSESEDTYLKIIGMKSAAQLECTCHVGALLAGASQKLINAFALFGRNLGMASQIGNDIQGIISGHDIIKQKITLPVIFALNLPDNEIRDKLIPVFQKQSSPVQDSEPVRKLLFYTGAIHYATVKMDLYKQKATDILSNIQETGANVEKLKLFLI
jgi:geranylgeranyl pyrophosphate synthase